MATPIREQILQGLLARAKKAHASAKRDVPLYNDDDLPKLILWDAQESNSPQQYGKDDLTLSIVIDYAQSVQAQTGLSTAANAIIAKIIAAMHDATDFTLTSLITSLRYRNSAIDYPEPGRGVLGVRVTFDVTYQTRKGDPYNG
jgi:hypothetical protein